MTSAGTVGWDIGGVNIKAARVEGGRIVARASRVYEVQRDPEPLSELMRVLSASLGTTPADRHAVTFTAELSQRFRTKAEGVAWVMDGVDSALPDASVFVVGIDRAWYTTGDARTLWPMVAAANWMATARMVARHAPSAILIDTGSTTTDIIPIVDGVVRAIGINDPGRLTSGELVYTGAVRTPIEALVHRVPLNGSMTAVAAESFALTGDVHVWLGALHPDDYEFTPDGRPATREFCGERLARVVCADRTMVNADALDAIATRVSDAQVVRIAESIVRVAERHPTVHHALCVGLGAAIAAEAARRGGLIVLPMPETLGAAAVIAPAAAAALLLDAEARC